MWPLALVKLRKGLPNRPRHILVLLVLELPLSSGSEEVIDFSSYAIHFVYPARSVGAECVPGPAAG